MYSKKPLERKYSVDSLKYLPSKPEVSKEKLPILGLQKNGSRAEALISDLNNEKVNRRAEIVAAVTKRLYSHGKKYPGEESKNLASIPIPESSSTPDVVSAVDEPPPPQSPVLEIPAMTKIRLQEISRKMLAKRRRIIADTQTDFYESTTRVKNVYTITDKIKHSDADVLTDEHEDLVSFGDSTIRVKRVKEMATLTDKLSTTIVRFKDATCVTENDNYSGDTPKTGLEMINEYTNMDANLNAKPSKSVDDSTNTTDAFSTYQSPPEMQSKSKRSPNRFVDVCCCHHRCTDCGRLLDEGKKLDDKNVISITLPDDLLRITLETSSSLESKITIVEDQPTKETRNPSKETKTFSDSQTQTYNVSSPFFKYYDFFGERTRFPTRTYGFAAMMDSRYRMSKTMFRQNVDTNLYRRSSPTSLTRFPNYSTNQSHTKVNSKSCFSNKSVGQSCYSVGRNKVTDVNKLLPLYDNILLNDDKCEEIFNSAFDLITEEVKINFSKRLTELNRYNSEHNSDVYFNRMYATSNMSLKQPWYGFKK